MSFCILEGRAPWAEEGASAPLSTPPQHRGPGASLPLLRGAAQQMDCVTYLQRDKKGASSPTPLWRATEGLGPRAVTLNGRTTLVLWGTELPAGTGP